MFLPKVDTASFHEKFSFQMIEILLVDKKPFLVW